MCVGNTSTNTRIRPLLPRSLFNVAPSPAEQFAGECKKDSSLGVSVLICNRLCSLRSLLLSVSLSLHSFTLCSSFPLCTFACSFASLPVRLACLPVSLGRPPFVVHVHLSAEWKPTPTMTTTTAELLLAPVTYTHTETHTHTHTQDLPVMRSYFIAV